jgi:hypothetical protein
MILYLKDPEDPTKNLLDLINTFSKLAENDINIQKSAFYMPKTNRLRKKSGKHSHSQYSQKNVPKNKLNK